MNNYIPDSIYTICGNDPSNCANCSNVVSTRVFNNYIVAHDPLRGKVLCPFGTKNSMNQSNFSDQLYNYNTEIQSNEYYTQTPFGRAPQMNPRPLSKIGIHWRM